jgi:hypothetical protein
MQANDTHHRESLTDKQRYWLTHVERCEVTGSTMVAYAGAQSLDLKQFYTWKMRLTRLGILPQSTKPVAFKRIAVRPTQEFGASCRIECPNGTRIQVAAGCDPAWLSLIFKAVGQSA